MKRLVVGVVLSSCMIMAGVYAASSSSSSSSSTSSHQSNLSKIGAESRTSIRTRLIQSTLQTNTTHIPHALIALIDDYAKETGIIYTAADIYRWVKKENRRLVYTYRRLDLPIHVPLPKNKRFPIAGLEPLWVSNPYGLTVNYAEITTHDYDYFNVSNPPKFAGFRVRLFNTRDFQGPYAIHVESPHICYLTYLWNPLTKTFKLDEGDTKPLGTFGTNRGIAGYMGYFSHIDIPQQAPELAIPQADGSIVHVRVADHCITGGTKIEWYLEEATSPIPPWNAKTIKERTVIKPIPKA